MATFEKVLQKNVCHRAAVLCSQKSGDFKHLFSCGLFSLTLRKQEELHLANHTNVRFLLSHMAGFGPGTVNTAIDTAMVPALKELTI